MATLIRLVPFGRGDQAEGGSAIVADLGEARIRTEGNSIFLIVGDELPLGRLKAGDIVRWAAEPLRVIWLAEQPADVQECLIESGPVQVERRGDQSQPIEVIGLPSSEAAPRPEGDEQC